MKNLSLILICILFSFGLSKADQYDLTILIETDSETLSNQIRMTGNNSQPLDQALLQRHIDEGYRIIDASVCKDGWSLILTKNCDIKDQWFKYVDELPEDWLLEMLRKDYHISALMLLDEKIFALVSDDPTIIGSQEIGINYLDDLTAIYDTAHDKGMVLTYAHPLADNWVWLMSKSTLRTEQEVFVVEQADLQTALDEIVYSNGYAVHNILNATPLFIVFYGNPNAIDGTKNQTVTINPKSTNQIIASHNKGGYYTSHICGQAGYALASNDDSDPTPSQMLNGCSKVQELNLAMDLAMALLGDGMGGSTSGNSNACSECHGTGTCNHCYGDGVKDGETCSYCNGFRACTRCSGTGKEPRSMFDNYNDSADDESSDDLFSGFSGSASESANTLSERWEVLHFGIQKETNSPDASKSSNKKSPMNDELYDLLQIFF